MASWRLPASLAVVLVVILSGTQPAASAQPDLRASAGTSVKAVVPGDVDSVSATVVRTGTRGYFSSIDNLGSTTVTGATVRMDTGWPISRFPGIGTLPIVVTQAAIPPGGTTSYIDFIPLCCTLVPSSFAPGFASSRVISDTRIGIVGGSQTIQMSLKITDPTLFPVWPVVASSIAIGNPTSLVGGVTVVSSTTPTNLDQGESLVLGGGPPSSLIGWTIQDARLNKEYRFTATLHVPNPTGTAFDFKPWMFIVVVPVPQTVATGQGTSISSAQPSLDGPVLGAGRVTFSVDQAVTWAVMSNENRELMYEGLFSCENIEQARCGPDVNNQSNVER